MLADLHLNFREGWTLKIVVMTALDFRVKFGPIAFYIATRIRTD